MPREPLMGLRIIICIKQVPKAQELRIDPKTNTLKRAGVESVINPPDRNALEMALQLVERHGGKTVVVSMGPPFFDASLQEAIGMGIDEGFLLTDRALGGSDTVPTAYALSKTVEKVGDYDLILCGEETTDSSTGHVGPGMAGHLRIPQMTYVSKVLVKDGWVEATRTLEYGLETRRGRTPALLTVNFGCNTPREPTLLGKIRAKRGGVIKVWNAADVGADYSKIGLRNSPTVVSKMETVVLPERKGIILDNGQRDAVSKLLGMLADEGVLRVG